MKKHINIFILFLFCILFSCKDRDKNNILEYEPVVIDVSIENVGKLDYKEWFSSYTVIPLETNDNCLIGEIGKIYVSDKYIIIFDSKTSNILLFSKEGDFVRQIGIKGSGPNEYLIFNDIFYESETQLIYAHERYQNRIFIYDLSGNLDRKTQVSKYQFNSFSKSEAGFWIYSCFKQNNEEGFNLMLLDDELQEQKRSFFPQKQFINAVFSSTFTCNEDGIPYFVYPTSNIIYELNNNKPKSYFEIDFGKKVMPYDIIKELTDHEDYKNLVADKKYLGGILNLHINQNICCFSFSESGFNIPVRTYTCFITLSDNKFHLFNNAYIESFDCLVPTQPVGITNNSIIYVAYPYIYSEESLVNLEKVISKKVTSEMNPILFLMDIKKIN